MTMLTAPTPEYYGVTRVVGPTGGPVAVAHAAFKSSVLFTRPNNATAYTAGDVIGRADTVTPANAGDAIIRLAAVGPVGGAVSLETVELHFDTNAIPAGMTTFRLHLYGLSPAAVLDNAVYNLSSAEIARYLGFITLNAPVDFGDTIYSITTDIRRHINLVPYSGSLFAELETVGAFTPAALTPVTLKVSSRQLSPATQLVEDLPIANSFPALPTLNLKFSESKNLFDDVTGRQLITFTRASTATFIDSAGLLQTAVADVPRFDHHPTTGESLGLLVEESRTNGIRNNTMVGAVAGTPGTLPTNWIATAATNLSREVIGTGVENGINYIDLRFTGTVTAARTQYIYFEPTSQIAAINGQSWAGSVWLKLAGGSLANITSVVIQADTRDSALVYANTPYGSTISLTSALTRFAASGLATGASVAWVQPFVQFTTAASGSIDITLRIGLPQLEQGAFATSVIPTTTAAATRSADVASITGTNFSSWYRQDEGTVLADATIANTGSNRFIAVASDATVNEEIALFWNTVFNSLVNDGAVSQANSFGGTVAAGSRALHSFAYKANDFQGYVNAVALSADTSGTLPTADRLTIGSRVNSTFWTNGTIRRLTYWPQRLANSTLQAITQ